MKQDTVVGRFQSIRDKHVKEIASVLSLSPELEVVVHNMLTNYSQELLRDCVSPHIDGTLPLGVSDGNKNGIKWG